MKTLGKTAMQSIGIAGWKVKPALRYRFSSALNALGNLLAALVDGGKTAPFYPDGLGVCWKTRTLAPRRDDARIGGARPATIEALTRGEAA